ncbi:nuclear transport factor 2 family protein [Janthinobacterium sp. PSPC1-1]|uniref:nuclear transport factor 2 family protein n=1 Tax=Janthinobacterium sp. PSPC1-1 TaxID=2804581 RepID=UPI003CEBA8DA
MIDLNNEAVDLAQQLETQRWATLLKPDFEACDALLSDEAVYIHSTGIRDDKAAFLKKFRAGVFVFHSASFELECVSAIGDDAFVATGSLRMTATVGGIDKSMHSLFSAVWRRESGFWRLLNLQTTAIPKASV